MKIAIHFNSNHPFIKTSFYGIPIHKATFTYLLQYRTLNISSKVFIEDLLLINLAYDYVETDSGMNGIFNKDKYFSIINEWINTGNNTWKNLLNDRIEEAIKCNVFVICFENIDHNLAEYMHMRLQEFPPYLGSLEVDDTSELHWEIYSHSLVPKYRIINDRIGPESIFWTEKS
jgi:hypothetical protein